MSIQYKLTSRKFWTMVAGLLFGAVLAFGGDDSAIKDMAGAVTAITSLVTYIRTEGKIDAAAISGESAGFEDAANSEAI